MALTGGIASGKSTVAHMLESLGAKLIDYDVLSKEVVSAPSPVLEQLRETFGGDVVNEDGSLCRQALANIVFNNAEKLAKLNAIMHPAVFDLAQQYEHAIISSACNENTMVIVHDIPLFAQVTQHIPFTFQAVLNIESSYDIRIQRMVSHRQMSVQEAASRIQSQSTDEQRRAVATHTIVNNGTIEELSKQVEEFYYSIILK
ncbi:MAG: dephospho-CoA kinase [Bifidobacteriaceae bacterium]|nr:dephospho-CoA kinase [Bifidobacteriaceae bacterium]